MPRFCFIIVSLTLFLFNSSISIADETSIGFVERLSGDIVAVGEGGSRSLSLDSEIFSDEAITTGTEARLLVRFKDESSLTLGENAHIFMGDFNFQPEASQVSQTLNILKGVFRFTSGKIAKAANQQVYFNTPVATIGIRGTDFLGGELTVGMPNGLPHYGFQLRDGIIDVVTPAGNVTLDEAGEGTFLPLVGFAAPTTPRIWSPEVAAEADEAIAF